MSKDFATPKYNLHYHITPPQGLLNDPNGLIQFKGVYHVFFQWNQHDTVHQSKSWGHVTSTDLVHWEYHAAALEPDAWYDKDGVYSGSAVSKNEVLYLFYTGNVRGKDGSRESYQCLAISEDGFHFEKKGPLFKHPEGYTRHVRDPKVFQDKTGSWWMLLGAQREDLTGDTILYQSDNLIDWTFKGSFLKNSINLGYMWECPDVLRFNENDLFVFSPQGLEAEENKFQNIYQTGYIAGEITSEGRFEPEQSFVELDKGFEFYAPQSFVDVKGRTILMGWAGVMYPEVEAAVPTRKQGWIHALTIPREIAYTNKTLTQQPVAELKEMRQPNPLVVQSSVEQTIDLPTFQSELLVDWEKEPKEFSLEIRKDVTIRYEQDSKRFIVSRINWLTQKWEAREVVLEKGLKNLRLFLESSLIELFINDGEEVFTLRYFTAEANKQLFVSQAEEQENRTLKLYTLKV